MGRMKDIETAREREKGGDWGVRAGKLSGSEKKQKWVGEAQQTIQKGRRKL